MPIRREACAWSKGCRGHLLIVLTVPRGALHLLQVTDDGDQIPRARLGAFLWHATTNILPVRPTAQSRPTYMAAAANHSASFPSQLPAVIFLTKVNKAQSTKGEDVVTTIKKKSLADSSISRPM